MTAYADANYYFNTYLGNEIAESNFPRLALRASAVIDSITFGRAATETDLDIIYLIKDATCAVAEEIQRFQNDGSTDGIASESNSGYSVSYGSGSVKQMT